MTRVLTMLAIVAACFGAFATGAAPLVIATPVALAGMWWLLQDPIALLAVSWLAGEYWDLAAGGYTAFKVGLMAQVGLVALGAALTGRKLRVDWVAMTLAAALVVWITMTELLGRQPNYAWASGLVGFAIYLFVPLQFLRREEDLDRIALLIAFATAPLFLWVLNELNWNPTGFGYKRILGPPKQPNRLGHIAVWYGLWSVAVMFSRQTWRRLIGAFGVASMLYVALASASRGAVVLLVVGGGALLALSPMSAARRASFAGAVAATVIVLIPYLPPVFEGRVIRTMEAVATADSVSSQERAELSAGRDVSYELGWEMLTEKPLVGHGEAEFRRRNHIRTMGLHAFVAHSGVVALVAAHGLPALLFTVLLLVYALRCAWVVRQRGRTPGMQRYGAVLIAITLVESANLLNTTAPLDPSAWLCPALSFAAAQMVRRDRGTAPEPRPADTARSAPPADSGTLRLQASSDA